MMRLDELFTIKNGVASSQVEVNLINCAGYIAYVRPSSTQARTLAGWIDPSKVKADIIYPKESLFVSTNGEGSHSYAYVSDFDFVPNSDVAVLIPKNEMTLQEKVFYARCITMNRYKFSYGRKPKGGRLGAIELPDNVPTWVNLIEQPLLENISVVKNQISSSNAIGKGLVQISDLFDISYGTSFGLNAMTTDDSGINFIARTSKNNGVVAKVKVLAEVKPIEGCCLTVAASGSVLETFYQANEFYSGFHILILRPRISMSVEQMLFYASCIRANQWKYSYGRQANKTLKTLPIPSFASIPDWANNLLTLKRFSSSIANVT